MSAPLPTFRQTFSLAWPASLAAIVTPLLGLIDAGGVSRKTINTVERGRFVPSAVLALKIARVLGLRMGDVFEV